MSVPGTATIARFVAAAIVGSLVTLGIAGVTQAGPTTTARIGPAGLYSADTPAGPVAFAVQPQAGGKALPQPPAGAGAQLISFTAHPVPSNPPDGYTPAWWASAGHSRVAPITQFDGGPLQAANCTVASGAMLARLAYGIVTTGSQLRALQSDQSGGTTLGDLEAALHTGWGVQFAVAAITPLQLRALLYAGAGAVVQGTYADIPVGLRLDPEFTGGHAIYLDGFRPPSAAGPAAYFVDDPIGLPAEGYKGGWWPADVVEKFATDFGGGLVDTAWAFAGGSTPPAHFPALPPSAFPSAAPGESALPGTSPLPTAAPVSPGAASPATGASPSASPILVPLPTPQASPPNGSSGDQGPAVPPSVSKFGHIVASVGGFSIVATLGACLAVPAPASCPAGIPALYPGGSHLTPPVSSPSPVDLLYASLPQPGIAQVIFESGRTSSFTYWQASAVADALPAATLDQALLGGHPVWIATFPVQGGSSYQFVAGSEGAGVSALSSVGQVTVGP